MRRLRTDLSVRTPLGEVCIDLHPRSPVSAEDRAVSLREVRGLVYGFTYRDPEARRAVIEIWERLYPLPAQSMGGPLLECELGSLQAENAARFVEDAARAGQIVIRRREAPLVIDLRRDRVEDAPSLGPEPGRGPEAWIGVLTVYENGDPAPNVAYRVDCPDGSVRTGQTGADGRARENGLVEGTCKLGLPEVVSTNAKGGLVIASQERLPLSRSTDQVHKIVLRRTLYLQRLYHDDRPVQMADFTVELQNGRRARSTLDANGEAWVPVTAPAERVQYGPDGRPWTRVDRTRNPDFSEEIDADAFVDERFVSTPGGDDDASSAGAASGSFPS